MNRRGQCPQQTDNSHDEKAEDLLGGNVTAKPPEHELGLADGWRFRQGRNEPESVGRRKTSIKPNRPSFSSIAAQ
ncbi:hypothetical protein ACVII1_001662 [Bradyrhizobium elkanii]|uniref:hypothetical protein n=1 Tax=Bradyrhizobium TaxID=374 RepID=UPI002711DF7B|nr:hypothetical protein [Bradyrhizobium elkanii]WLA36263.1 hypothetical protein QNJ95_24835 [Bradyrhizobium elkanii]